MAGFLLPGDTVALEVASPASASLDGVLGVGSYCFCFFPVRFLTDVSSLKPRCFGALGPFQFVVGADAFFFCCSGAFFPLDLVDAFWRESPVSPCWWTWIFRVGLAGVLSPGDAVEVLVPISCLVRPRFSILAFMSLLFWKHFVGVR